MRCLNSCNYLHDLYNNKEYPLYFILSFTKIKFIEIDTTYRQTFSFFQLWRILQRNIPL